MEAFSGGEGGMGVLWDVVWVWGRVCGGRTWVGEIGAQVVGMRADGMGYGLLDPVTLWGALRCE